MKKYKTDFSEEELYNAFHKRKAEAEDILNDTNKWKKIKTDVWKLLKKIEKIPVIGGMVDDIECMVYLVDSYIKKEYKAVPVSSIVSIIAVLVYLLSPIDLLTDAIPFFGYIDDAAIILMVLDLGIGQDLDKYRNWNEKNRINAISKLKTVINFEIKNIVQDSYIAAMVMKDENNIRIILCDNKMPSEWEEFYIKEMFIPTELLRDYSLIDEKDIQKLLNETMELKQLPIIDGVEKIVYMDSEFIGEWDDYIIRER